MIAAAIVLADRLTKYWIETSVSLYDTWVVIPGFFNIVHTQNTGMAFGLLSDAPGAWRTILLIGVALAVLAAVFFSLWNLPAQPADGQKYTRLGLALILGGAIGNLYDRIAQGSVTDFLEFYAGAYSWPAFNVADSAITIGAALLVLDLLRSRRAASGT
ncbi:MAG: signal peptidase II [Bryobacteraceae bacterium]|nr:signal peptidase II [Bryobacteraceae bacterium]